MVRGRDVANLCTTICSKLTYTVYTIVTIGTQEVVASFGERIRLADELQRGGGIWSEDDGIFWRCFEEGENSGTSFVGTF